MIYFYSHFLVVVAVTILFGWRSFKLFSILVILINFFLLGQTKDILFFGFDIALIGVILGIDLRHEKV